MDVTAALPTPVAAPAIAAEMATVVGRGAVFVLGALVAGFVALSALRALVVPRGETVWLVRVVFSGTGRMFGAWASPRRPYEDRDRIMARYAPTALILLPASWLVLEIAAFSAMFWGVGADTPRDAFYLSGASITTLGSFAQEDLPAEVLSFVEAGLGLGLVALLISYLPSIYSAFQRRELSVTTLETRAGNPPSAVELVERHASLARLDAMDELWPPWEEWFADVEESHTSQPALVHFRSPLPGRSWVNSAGVLLDAASLRLAAIDLPRDPRAALCIRAGYLCLRRIADFYTIPYDPAPAPDDPISVDRRELELVLVRLEAAGAPIKADHDQIWRDFAGWRVNYDQVLLALAGLTMAPWSLWCGDRAVPVHAASRFRLRRRWQAAPGE